MELHPASRPGAMLLLVLAAVGWLGLPARAADPVLVVSGLPDGERSLTLDELRGMGATEITTSTPWTEGQITFTGVTGRRFVEVLQATGAEILADAINGYRVKIPFDVLNSDELLIAYSRDGQEMPVRDKGPLWVVFAYDADERFVSETYKAYSIWNLIHLEFH